MNAFKSIETAFVAATAVAITGAAVLMPATAKDPIAEQAAPMHVVVVSAKRMSAEEKLQSLREEQMALSRTLVARG